MSLLQEAAEKEDRRWGNYLTRIRSQAARDYLSQVGRVTALIVIGVLLADGARRDLLHGLGTVVSVSGGVTLQTASGKSAPAQSFVGQSVGLGDSLTTAADGNVTVTYLDGTVARLGPSNQLRQTQSTSFRNGSSSRWFQTGSGPLQLYNPNPRAFIALVNPNGGAILGGGSTSGGSYFAGSSVTTLSRYSVKQGALVGLERAVWWPLDALLGKIGVSNRGTLTSTDSQRRSECRSIALGLQKVLPTATGLPEGSVIALSQLSLPTALQQSAEKAVEGPYLLLKHRGVNFSAQLTARDSERTVFTITPQGVQETRKK